MQRGDHHFLCLRFSFLNCDIGDLRVRKSLSPSNTRPFGCCVKKKWHLGFGDFRKPLCAFLSLSVPSFHTTKKE